MTTPTPKPTETESSYFRSISRSEFRNSVQFRTRTVEYKFVTRTALELKEDVEDQDATVESGHQWLEGMIEEVMRQIWKKDSIHPNDLVAMTIYGGDLQYPVSLPMYPYQSPKHQRARIFEEVSRIQQSKRDWLMGCSLEIMFTIVSSIKAEGRRMTTSHIMTELLFAEALERRIITHARPLTSELNLTNDIDAIIRRYESLHQLQFIMPSETDDDWIVYLNQWCLLNPYINVLVLHLPYGVNHPHEVRWKSASTTIHHNLVLWHHEAQGRIYEVCFPNLLYGKRNIICLKCGVVYGDRGKHN